jgi:hypothetical protein
MDKTKAINENCLYCGTSLAGMCQPKSRKYCSTTCGNKYKLRQKSLMFRRSYGSTTPPFSKKR